LKVQPKEGGKPHLRLNMATNPIANKYREGKLQSTLKRKANISCHAGRCCEPVECGDSSAKAQAGADAIFTGSRNSGPQAMQDGAKFGGGLRSVAG